MTETPRRSTLSVLKEMGRDRSLLVMLLLGLAAGLPYAVLTGTLNAWFTETDVDVATIGVLSWIGLAYAFKFLWSPALHRSVAPITGRLGSRRGWMLLFQFVVMATLGVIAASDPTTDLPRIALFALLCVVASASQDIVIDAWRIEVARDSAHLDTLSVIYQFGHRSALFLGSFGALILASRIGWSLTFGILALMMGLGIAGVALAHEPKRDEKEIDEGVRLGANLPPRLRYGALAVVLAGWTASFAALGWFMYQTVTQADPPDARGFIRNRGPWIVTLTVLMPAIVSAILTRFDQGRAGDAADQGLESTWTRAADTLHRVILEPMMDIVGRLGWAAPLVLLLILSYRFVDLVWGSFAYPFYLGTDHGALGYTLDEVAIASKMIGVIVTILGTLAGGLALKAFDRMSCLIAGAVLAAVTNLLFWDLATGARFVGGFLEITGLVHVFGWFGADERLALLITAIAGENLAVGFASAVFVAYLSSIVNPTYAAVQYALLASLTMLVGTLGRGALGEWIEERGFAFVFIVTALLGLVAVFASAAEAVRQRVFAGPLPVDDDTTGEEVEA